MKADFSDIILGHYFWLNKEIISNIIFIIAASFAYATAWNQPESAFRLTSFMQWYSVGKFNMSTYISSDVSGFERNTLYSVWIALSCSAYRLVLDGTLLGSLFIKVYINQDLFSEMAEALCEVHYYNIYDWKNNH